VTRSRRNKELNTKNLHVYEGQLNTEAMRGVQSLCSMKSRSFPNSLCTFALVLDSAVLHSATQRTQEKHGGRNKLVTECRESKEMKQLEPSARVALAGCDRTYTGEPVKSKPMHRDAVITRNTTGKKQTLLR
jgi:hypothetical protein